MRAVALMLIGGLLGVPAEAADAPAIVIPGRPGVPVIINGGDASYCVVEGDWGLARPGHVPVTVVACPHLKPIPGYEASYFPAFGQKPGYGRLEIEPPPDRKLPPPAPSYYREWGVQSDPVPASPDPPANVEINVEPRIEGRRRELPPQDIRPQDIRPQDIRPQDIRPQDTRPRDTQPQDAQPQNRLP